ncbi:hypothetical protein [Sulfurimonas sp.]|uniref:OadG family protein n=1 Tax=Sulfurimonas sp. TaxID=2022749 RepID=UPI0019F2311D|nr:hypothetical protein [Sulfurimonas sp.]MBE0514223.1 hypothetical protein [Sulfurimonas sp.]
MIDLIDINLFNFIDFDFTNILIEEKKEDWWKEKMFKWIEDFGQRFFDKKIWFIPDFIVDLVKSFLGLILFIFGIVVVFFLISLSPFIYTVYKLFRMIKPKKTDITN